MLAGFVAQQVDGEGVGDDHDDHWDVESGQGSEESEAPVVDDALVADHNVGRVNETQGADGRADEKGQEPDEDDTDGHQTFGTAARQEAAAAAASTAVPSGPQRTPDAQVAAQRDAAHVKDGRRAGQNVASDVDVAPSHAQRPIS